MPELPEYESRYLPRFVSRIACEFLHPLEHVHPAAQMKLARGRRPQDRTAVEQFVY
jgi:hypothetical protein